MRQKSNIQILNKKAKFEYIILDRYTAGIQLFGTEIKSIREGKASLVDSYCAVEHGEMYVKQMHIAEYRFGSYANHEAKRDRKLLLTKREIQRLADADKQPGYTIVPTLIFIDENGRAKVDIALCRGKKEYDKRQTLKEKEDRREMDRAIKHY
jgi:SsrA-binding protein